MYYLKVNGALKVLVTETADACGITTAAIMRKVALKIAHNTLCFGATRNEIVFRRGDNVTAHLDVPETLSALDIRNERVKAEMTAPAVGERAFRLALAGYCMNEIGMIAYRRRVNEIRYFGGFATAEVAR